MAGIIYPDLPSDLTGPSWRFLKFFGAGAIVASVTIGSGETLFASKGGALFAYGLLWCFVISALTKGIQVYTAARYMTLTGQHPMTHWAKLPGPNGWVPLSIGILSIVCFPFFLSGLPLAIGKTVNWIFGLTGSERQLLLYARCIGTLCIFVAVGLTWIQSFGFLERVQTAIIGILLVCVLASCLATNPNWTHAIAGLIPSIPEYPIWMQNSPDVEIQKIVKDPPWIWVGLFLGAIGGGTYDYIGYIGCLREKKWGAIGRESQSFRSMPTIDLSKENIARARVWLWPAKIDVGIGFLCVLIFTICFVMLGAEILHPRQLVPAGDDLLTHQARFLTRFHPSLLVVYQIGVFTAFWGTIYGAYEIYSRTVYECIRPLSRRAQQANPVVIRRATLAYCGIVGLILLWIFKDPERLVMPAAIVGGVFTCGLWCFAMIWADRRFLPKPLQMGPTLLILNVISGVILTALGVKSIWDYVQSLFG